MNCRYCGKEIEKRGFDWVHTESTRYRCTDKPTPDPQQYAEPFYTESFDNPRLIGDQTVLQERENG
jgi:hypothetical protein